jgi:phosphonate transport system substrate-binding protein
MVIRPPTWRRIAPGVAVAVALALVPLRAPAQGRARERILVGLVPEVNIFKQKARFDLLGEHLTRRLGIPVRFTILSRYGSLLASFEADRMDGAFFGSFTGALAIERLGVVPLARPVNLDGTSTYHGYLFVRKDSGISGVEGMRGKRMAFVDRATTAGYLFPRAWLRERGIPDPERFFSETWFTGSHDAAISAVLEGKADVGATKHSVLEQLRMEDPRVGRELVILATSPSVPSNGLCVSRDLEEDLREALRRALLGLHEDPEGARVLEQFGAMRFVETTVADYAPVLELARRAGLDLAHHPHPGEPGRATADPR